jgi:hypothetical protein
MFNSPTELRWKCPIVETNGEKVNKVQSYGKILNILIKIGILF